MTCEDLRPFVDHYVDGEFDDLERTEIEVHLASCDECRALVEHQVEWKRQLKASLGEERAPDRLRARIFEGIENLELPEPDVAAEVVVQPPPSFWKRAWVAIPVAAALMLVVSLPSLTVAPATSGEIPIVEQTIEWHRGDYPIEVTGPDTHFVSQWFQNKVDFPVRLPTFAPGTASLLGARIANIDDRRAAYALYEVDGAKLSVMGFNGKGLAVPTDKIRKIAGRDVVVANKNGYTVAVLQDSGVTYTLTTELPEDRFIEVLASSLRR